MATSRYVEIRPDNVPADGIVSFKNGFPVLSFTVSAQDGLLDPQSIRIVGKLAVYSDNATPTPTPAQDGDGLNMNSRLGIYNVFDQLTIRAARSKMICEQIRHYSKWFNTYTALSSSIGDQISHLAESALIMPNSELFRKSVVESNAAGTKISSFSAHLPCGFAQSGNMVDLRPTAFGGVQVEIQLTPDANALFFEGGSVPAGKGECHYQLSDLKLCCEVHELPADVAAQQQGSFQFNTITSLYTSINSANAQIQYSLALKNLQSAYMTFMPVSNINTLTADGQATTYPSDSDAGLAAIKRVQFLKGGVKYPAEFDYVNSYDATNNPTNVPDPQIVKGLYDAIVPAYHQVRTSIGPTNMNRGYTMTTGTGETAYNTVANGGAVMGLGVKYGIGDAGDDFSQEQFGASIESDLATDNPIGVFLFFKSKATLLYSQMGVQLIQ
jgi:hypothetical protein